MNRPCPQCGSTETGPSFTFDWDKDDTGQVIARNPFFLPGVPTGIATMLFRAIEELHEATGNYTTYESGGL